MTLKGGKYYSLSKIIPDPPAASRSLLFSPFVGVSIDAGWSSQAEAANNASLSFRPSLGISSLSPSPVGPPKFRGPWLHAYVDLRERYGKYKQADGTLLQINQTMAGAGAEFRVVWFDDWLGLSKQTGKIDEPPRLSLTYYTVKGTSVDEAVLPDNLKADVVQLEFKMGLTLPRLQCTAKTTAPADDNDPFGAGSAITCPWRLTVDLLGTKPTTGRIRENEWMADAALVYDTGTSL